MVLELDKVKNKNGAILLSHLKFSGVTIISALATEWILKKVVAAQVNRMCHSTGGFACEARPMLFRGIESFVRVTTLSVIAHRTLGIDVRQILQGAGIFGLLIAYLVRDTLENFQAGLIIVGTSPFSPGDVIQVRAQMQDHRGQVQSINTRHTVLLQEDGQLIRMPNSLLVKSILRTPGPGNLN
mmetsp:Transcript_3043/g.4450  ORF Transcript_3043/g.4450 Transcript_3043/m.4450 type:complete len:184 (-) Transcript_3043:61-612(-)